MFQSTHPRRVWLDTYNEGANIILVSIHTPTKGVTIKSTYNQCTFDVSIHTPTKGVTMWSILFVGGRRVSIHTPTKGVTKKMFAMIRKAQFQSTHPRRVWPTFVHLNKFLYLFQSTHPRRVWLTLHTAAAYICKVSIHTPTKGVTPSALQCRLCHDVSIHTPTKGVTSVELISLIIGTGFNPHTHEGCDCIFSK